MKFFYLFFLFFLATSQVNFAQPFVYFSGNSLGNPNTCVFGQLNLATCEICEDFTLPFCVNGIVALPNGQVGVLTANHEIEFYDSATGNLVFTYTPPPSVINITSAVLDANGNVVYATIEGGLIACIYEYNPTTGTTTNLGCTTGGYFFNEIFFLNGQLYAYAAVNNPPFGFTLLTITFGNPLQVNIIPSSPGGCILNSAVLPDNTVITSCGFNIIELDPTNGNNTLFCQVQEVGFLYGLSSLPAGFPPANSACSCTTNAGMVNNNDSNLCENEVLNFTHSGETLDVDDVLEFILYSDVTNPLSSILLTNSTTDFSFTNPPLTLGTTYYVAAIAGNQLPAGGVDLSDPCLSLSAPITVTWFANPTVSFSLPNADVCQGECADLTVTLTGTPPFQLTYDTPSNPNQTANFSTLSDILTVCVPLSTNAGGFNIQAVSLTDNNCTCD